jgi:outer membrane protein assembly factor BamB
MAGESGESSGPNPRSRLIIEFSEDSTVAEMLWQGSGELRMTGMCLKRMIGFAVGLCVAVAGAHAQVDVLTQHNDNARTGANLRETALTPENVNKAQFGMLFRRVLDDQLYTQPLIVTKIQINGGTHDIVYVTTVNNSAYAFDANDSEAGSPIWHVNFGTPANVHSTDFGCLDINGQMGIIGTPVIDKVRGVLYVVSLARAGAETAPHTGFIQRLHALDLSTGADLPQSPVEIKAHDFNALMQNQRPALALANGMVYVGYASHCDRDPYHGFLMAYDAKNLSQITVLNTSPTGSEASIWQSGQGPAVDQDGNIYVVTGNGSWDGVHNFSESFLKLSPRLKLLDWFTPSNHFALDKQDADLNASGASLIPGTHLVLGGGKEGILYTLDTRNFGHLGDEHAFQHFKATASHLHSLVSWQSAKAGRLLYVWGQRDKAKVYKFEADKLQETPLMMRDVPNQGHPGAMLSLSANGDKDGILWAAIHATGDSWHESRPGILHAYDATDIRHELWNSLELPARDDCGEYSKMAPPTIANGRVYLASFGAENVGTGQFCVYGLLPSDAAQQLPAPTDVKATIIGNTLTINWSPVPQAQFYRVVRSSTLEPEGRQVATGLTTPQFVEPAPERGETATYRIVAVGTNGISPMSSPLKLLQNKKRKPMED